MGKFCQITPAKSGYTRVTRCFCEKVAQNVAQTICCQIYYDKISIEENGSNSLAIFSNFRKMLQRKKWLNWRKFALSGHPG
jgi:hypothetical protein